MKKLSLRAKLALAFGLCILFAGVLGAFSLWSAGQLSGYTVEIASRWMPAVSSAKGMQNSLLELNILAQRHILATDDDGKKAVETRIAAVQSDFAKHRGDYGALPGLSSSQAALAKIDESMKKFGEGLGVVVMISNQGNNSGAADRIRSLTAPLSEQMSKTLAELVAASTAGSNDAAARAGAARSLLVKLTAGIIIALVASASTIAWAITRSVSRQLGGDPSYAFDVVQRIAAGDLTVDIRTERGDTSSLLHAMRGMSAALAATVQDVQGAADSIHNAASEVASGNMDLSQRTEQQAARLQETASSMEQLSGVVRQTDDSTRAANDLALSATQITGRGRQMVERLASTMGEISASSHRIAEISGVIDGIAFQTSILALNAAVEAARAGDQGRSFAVVATEVRNLAQRCGSAAKEIKLLVGASTEAVDAGSRLMLEADGTMGEIVDAVAGVNQRIGQISSASVSQSSDLKQVSASVSQLDQATQQNAALVEQSAAAATNLSQQATRLVKAVSQFKVRAAVA